MVGCTNCNGPLSPQNRSGYCRRCYAKHGLPAYHGQRVSDALKRKYALDPASKERVKLVATANLRLPQTVAGRLRSFVEARRWEQAVVAAATPEARLKAAQTRRERALAWCPPELREEYVRLNQRCHVPKVEAQRIILDQHEKNMREFRRRIGA